MANVRDVLQSCGAVFSIGYRLRDSSCRAFGGRALSTGGLSSRLSLRDFRHDLDSQLWAAAGCVGRSQSRVGCGSDEDISRISSRSWDSSIRRHIRFSVGRLDQPCQPAREWRQSVVPDLVELQIKMHNKITAHNAGWRSQFRFAGSVSWPGVCEFRR